MQWKAAVMCNSVKFQKKNRLYCVVLGRLSVHLFYKKIARIFNKTNKVFLLIFFTLQLI